MIHNIWKVSPSDYPHSQCFNEIALGFQEALRELGHTAEIKTSEPLGGKTLVFGAHLLKEGLEGDFIIFNTEQIVDGSPWMTPLYKSLLEKFEVWDYSPLNVEKLKALGITSSLCEIGYSPVLSNIVPVAVEDIDVLFYGSLNERRTKILEGLKEKGVGVLPLVGYGQWRDKYIARAKIVLNLHFYESKIFEVIRCSHLMANKKCVISEFGEDKALEEQYYGGINFQPYDSIVASCVELLASPDDRKVVAENGFKVFSKKSQVEILKRLLCEPSE